MAKFSTSAASALSKVLKRKTLVQIKQTMDALVAEIKGDDDATEYVEQEARRVLDVKYNAAGNEIIDKGRLESNLTRRLDGPDLARALGVATSVHNLIAAERKVWLEERKKYHESFPHAPVWFEGMERNAGPGITIPDVGRKT